MTRSLSLAFSPRFICLTLALLAALGFAVALLITPGFWTGLGFVVAAALSALGLRDLFHPSHAILRNYPIAAHLRFIMEEIRPEMRQYFFEDEKHGTPFSRDKRAIVYQRAKKQLDKRPFGTQYDVYETGFEWLQHSLAARAPAKELPRILIGGPACTRPYSASILNIS
ncbi:MAG: FMN-binding glutamate synthase family protein, partial [Alphaproteobacteria bacterium]